MGGKDCRFGNAVAVADVRIFGAVLGSVELMPTSRLCAYLTPIRFFRLTPRAPRPELRVAR